MKSVFTAEYKALLQTLLAARKAAGITQHQLAERLRKPQSFVSKYERHERRLDVVEFVVIARALGLDPAGAVQEIDTRLAKRSKSKAGQ